MCTRSTRSAQFTSQHAEGTAHAVKRGRVSGPSTVRLISKPKPKMKMLNFEMRGGGGGGGGGGGRGWSAIQTAAGASEGHLVRHSISLPIGLI